MSRLPYRYFDRKEEVRRILIDRARSGEPTSYAELGASVGIPTQGPWKALLDDISVEETEQNKPDITFLVVNSRGISSQINFQPARMPSNDQLRRAKEVTEEIYKYYSK